MHAYCTGAHTVQVEMRCIRLRHLLPGPGAAPQQLPPQPPPTPPAPPPQLPPLPLAPRQQYRYPLLAARSHPLLPQQAPLALCQPLPQLRQ